MDGVSNRPAERLPTESASGPMNMARDDVAAERATTTNTMLTRVYSWEPSTLSLGYAQDPETVDWSRCEAEAIDVTRRQTGGGAIFHDAVGDIAYSIAVPNAWLPDDLTTAYQLLCQPVIDAFERMGVPVQFAQTKQNPVFEPVCYLRALSPSHDLVVATETGEQKISGNAQHRTRDVIVQHGSLTFESDARKHLQWFVDTDHETAFRKRVTSISAHANIGRSTAVGHLETALDDWANATLTQWKPAEQKRAERLVASKYGATKWITRKPGSVDI